MADESGGRPVKRLRCSSDDTIRVLVGREKIEFSVHATQFCAKSPFFEAALKRGWKEAEEKMIDDSGLQDFEQHKLTDDPDNWKAEGQKDHESLCCGLGGLWIFADAMLDHDLCNHITDIILDQSWIHTRGNESKYIDYIWTKTSSDCILRELFTDVYANIYRWVFRGNVLERGWLWDSVRPLFEQSGECQSLFEVRIQVSSKLMADWCNHEPPKVLDVDMYGGIVPGAQCNYHRHAPGEGCYLSPVQVADIGLDSQNDESSEEDLSQPLDS